MTKSKVRQTKTLREGKGGRCLLLPLLALGLSCSLSAASTLFIINQSQTTGPGSISGSFTFDPTTQIGYDLLSINFTGGAPGFSAVISLSNIGFPISSGGLSGYEEGPDDSDIGLVLGFQTPLNLVTPGSTDIFNWHASFTGSLNPQFWPSQFLYGTGAIEDVDPGMTSIASPEPETALSFPTGLLLIGLAYFKLMRPDTRRRTY